MNRDRQIKEGKEVDIEQCFVSKSD